MVNKTMVEFDNNFIESLVIGHAFRKQEFTAGVLSQYRAVQYRDVLYVELDIGEAWLFDYGVLVFWGVNEAVKDRMLTQLKNWIDEPIENPKVEHYTFEVKQPALTMREDCLYFEGNDHRDRLAASHALAQSVKLIHFEEMAQRVIAKNEYIPKTLAKTGKMPLSRKQLAKLRGTLFSVKSDILLNFNLLDTPEFFWGYPELEPIYEKVSKYLDIVSRINVLNKKLETIHELLDMLANEQNHRHSSILEWIVIILIAVEVVLFFVH